MTLKRAISLDVLCWVALIVSVWLGPQWVTKLAISIMIIWNGLCISWLARNSCYKDYCEQNFN
jgi:hypothetical protein